MHTPLSIVQQYGGNTEDVWEKYIQDLENLPSEFKVLGINDYLFLDGYSRLKNEKEQNGRLANIELLLPVVEFRIEKFAGVDFRALQRINLHVIFSNEITIETIQSQFLNTLEQSYQIENGGDTWVRAITRESVSELGEKIINSVPEEQRHKYGSSLTEGFNNLNVKEDQIFKALEKDCFKDRFLIAIGKTEWDQLKWTDASILTKKDIINKASIVFTSALNIEAFNNAKVKLTNQGVNDLLLDCSDAHRYSDDSNKDRIGKCFTWIKANSTFEGLKQVINEPKDRVYIGEIPSKLRLVNSNKDKFIEKIEINKILSSTLADKWFENTNPIPLNSDLIAIIGNKGNGKSALADITALSANAKLLDSNWFSFLNNKRFKDKSLASNFESTIFWRNGTSSKINLNSVVPEDAIEKVKYLPQKYIEKICTEDEYSSFQDEINKVVFSHIKEQDRLGKQNLQDLIKSKTELVGNKRKELLSELQRLLETQEELKTKYSKNQIGRLEKSLAEKEQQISDHSENKKLITDVKDPMTDTDLQDEIKFKFEKSKTITEKINALKNELADIQGELNTLSIQKNTVEIVIGEFDLMDSQLSKFKSEKQQKLNDSNIEIDIESIFKIQYDKKHLADKLENIVKQIFKNNEKKIQKSDELGKLLENKTKVDSELTEPQKAYQGYLEQIKLWDMRNNELVDEKTAFEKEINFSRTELPIKLSEYETRKIALIAQIYNTYNKELEIFKELYSSVLEFVSQEKEKLGSESFIDFTTQIIIDKKILINSLVAFFDGRRQRFQDVELKELVAKYSDDTSLDNIKEMFTELIDLIEKDKRPLKQQFRDGKQLIDFYLELFGLKYLKVEYDILFGGKNVKQLSPGERGALLIIFYLLIDKGDIPLIIDQPEDNLDNESVFEYLVPYIKQAKQRRQIIIVTHNPNIAVVADAEQIIYTELDKANGNQIKYITGAIEDKQINKEIVKILEGTMPAFDNRTIKYYRD